MRSLALSIFLISLQTTVVAQLSTTLINEANQLLTDGKDYPAAITKLETAIGDPTITASDMVRAQYGLADAKLRESQRQVSLVGENIPIKYKEYVYEATDLLLEARKNLTNNPDLKEPVDLRINALEKALTMNMVQLVQEKERRQGKDLDAILNELLRVCRSVQKLNGTNYSAWDYEAQVQIVQGDSLLALSSMQKAINIYETQPQSEPDGYAGYMYYRVALLQNNHRKDAAAASSTLKNGLEKLKSDRADIATNSNMNKARKDYVTSLIAEVESKIDLFLVDLLIRDGASTPEEQKLIEETIAKHPENMNLMFQYAKMISKDDPVTACKVYDGIIERDPMNTVALYNAGVLYFNVAATLSQDTQNATRADDRGIEEQMLVALEYFKRAEQLGQKAAIQPILQIAQFFSDDALYQKYSARQ